MQPLSIQERSPIIDILRGWALFGVAIGNYRNFYYIGHKITRAPDNFATYAEYPLEYLFYSKSMTLLSILFGYGFSMLMRNIHANVKSPAFFFAGRMFWLFVFGVFNSLLYFGDILRNYAVLGMLLLFFYQTSAKRVLYIGIAIFLILPFIGAYIATAEISYREEIRQLYPLYYSTNWFDYFAFNFGWMLYFEILDPDFFITEHLMLFSCMLLGVAAHRSELFANFVTNKKLIKRVFWIGLVAVIILNVAYTLLTQSKSLILHYFDFNGWIIISTTLTISAGICWLYLAGRLKNIFVHLQMMGRMALTNYVTMCALIAVIFSGPGLGLFNTMPFWFYLVVPFGIYTIQLILSKYWLLRYNYGPLEWLWRKLSYRTKVPFKKQAIHRVSNLSN